MNKINQALESKQNGKNGVEPTVAVPLSSDEPIKPSGPKMEEEMIGLYHSIDSKIPDSEKKVIQFIGSTEGEGTSTITREFARVVSEKFGKSVFLLDTDLQKPSQLLFFDNKFGRHSEEAFSENEPIGKALNLVSGSHLFVKSLLKHSHASNSNQASDFMSNSDIWESLKQKFDFILVDSLPSTTSSNALAFSRNMDGVVLVVEAEKTRWQVVESVKDKISSHGGKIIGVVLNKRKYYIPGFIYKSL